MDDESGESMELMEEMPFKVLGEAELERLVRGWRREAGSWQEYTNLPTRWRRKPGGIDMD